MPRCFLSCLVALATVAVIPGHTIAGTPDSSEGATFVGSASCKTCHEQEYAAWANSHHALAMRRAVGDGPFASMNGVLLPDEVPFGESGLVRFTQVRTSQTSVSAEIREQNASSTWKLAYILGATPLVQPLVAADRGRLQALPIAFDPTAKIWFDVFSGDERLPGDYGHWLGRGMNANSNCLACHTTDYRERYDAAADSYNSTWSEMGVGCEACHGPGSTHVADTKLAYPPFGRDAALAEYRPSARNAPDTEHPGTAATSLSTPRPPATTAMLDLCATCHGLRREITAGFRPGSRLLDHYDPVLLDENDYEADGQVRGESYEWGSFQQSRMHERGVTCLACHDVHTGGLRAEGNALCLGCHEARLATTSHTGHEAESTGSLCVACHMPEKVFMTRDRRRDHSLSIPDPIAVREGGIASACEQCHASRGRDALAADALRLWPVLTSARFVDRRALAGAVASARRGSSDGAAILRGCLAGKGCEGAFARAGAAKLLARTTSERETVDALVAAVLDPDPLVRNAATYSLAEADVSGRAVVKALLSAAEDETRAVRVQAAWALRNANLDSLAVVDRMSVESAFAQWKDAATLDAAEPETQHNLALFLAARGDRAGAEAAYRRAVAIEPAGVASRHNLAMLLVADGRVDAAFQELQALVEVDAGFAPAWHALGLIAGERGDWPGAAQALGRCLKLDPGYPGALTDLTHAYLESGVANVARAVLTAATESPVARREALAGLVVVALKAGDRVEAARWARELVKVDSGASSDPTVAELVAN